MDCIKLNALSITVWFRTLLRKIGVKRRGSKRFKLTTLKAAGMQHYDAEYDTFILQERLRFKREPENTYDRYAIALYYNERKIGYLPKAYSQIFASLLDNGIALEVEVRYFDKERPPWERLWVSVWQVE